MANNLVHYTCYLAVLSSCVDQGHGGWKKRERGNLQQEVSIHRKVADTMEHEMEAFYEDYADNEIKRDDVENIHSKYRHNTMDFQTDVKRKRKELIGATDNFIYASTSNVTSPINVRAAPSSDLLLYDAAKSNTTVSFENVTRISAKEISNKVLNPSWPKFEDIILAMGKKYDWKNDRWIKVKRKLKLQTTEAAKMDSNINFREKHKFSYRTVKLKRSKSRRNVVIAVLAVR